MASKLIQFRLSGDVLEALEAQVKEGDSINLVAQRILAGALGVNKNVDKVFTPDLDGRIGAVVEDKLSSFAGSINDLLGCLQERIQALEVQVANLSIDSQADLSTPVDSSVYSVSESVDELEESQSSGSVSVYTTVDTVDQLEDSQPSDSSTVDRIVDSVDDSLTGKELAKRLGVDPGTLTRNRSKPTFTDWARGKDPEGKAWQYLSKVKRYIPALSTDVSTASTEKDSFNGWKAQVDAVVGEL
ncbi:MAG TPA: hypothetical protein V6C95_21995 [Coleofasciculaceae cyanobacterium]